MKASWTIRVILLVLGIWILAANGLKCFVCNSIKDEGCNDKDLLENFVMECPEQTHGSYEAVHLEPNNSTGRNTTSESGGKVWTRTRRDVTLSSTLTEASTNSTETLGMFLVCRKDDLSIPAQHNGKETKEASRRIVRYCGWIDKAEKDGCRLVNSEGITQVQCSCFEDACNASQFLKTDLVSYALGLVVVLISFMFFTRP